ncbi:hypothetical protein C8Q80DRAFT_1276350 [Daedaleopsis nitida]|nr:hypothetical protein C8Q80DRAFT_1276350 [Daedaleopsis nitida]
MGGSQQPARSSYMVLARNMLNLDITTFFITCLMLLVHPDAMAQLLLPLLSGCYTFIFSVIETLSGLCSRTLPSLCQQHTRARVQISTEQSSPAQFSVSPIQVDPDTYRQLNRERVQSHLKVKELERNNASLRSRIWFLEDTAKSLRDDVTQRAREYQELVDANGTLVAEKDEIVADREAYAADCRDLTQEVNLLRSEKKVLQDSKDFLVEDVEELQAEMDEMTKGNELLLGEKASLEEGLTRETSKRRQAQSQVKQLEEESAMIKAHLASKQDTLDDLMEEIEALEDDLKNAVQTAQEFQHEVENLRETTTHLLGENGLLKAELAAAKDALHEADELRKANTVLADEKAALTAELKSLKGSTCPRSHLNAARADLQTSNAALEQLRTEHQLQAGCLNLCRTALPLANEERAILRGTAERHRANQRVSEDLEDSLVASLAARDVQIAQLKASLERREAECAELRAPVREHHGRELKAALRERHARDLKTVLAKRDTRPRPEIANVARMGTRTPPARAQATSSLVLRSPPTSRPPPPASSPECNVDDTPTRPSRSQTVSKIAPAPLRLPRRISSGTPPKDATSPTRRTSWV